MSRFGALLFVCVFASGCVSWGSHADSVLTCERGFVNDPDWSPIARPGREVRTIWRQFRSFEFEGVVTQPQKVSTLWFRNTQQPEIGACSMHSCESGRCVWRVRLFSKESGHWQLRSGYDIGKPRENAPAQ